MDYQFTTAERSKTCGAATSRVIVIHESAWLVGASRAEVRRQSIFLSIGLKSR